MASGALLNDRIVFSQRIITGDLEKHMSRFLLALLRNCGVAIAISIFFAAARGPSHLATEVTSPESAAPTPGIAGCDRPAIRVCRLVDAGQ